METGFRSYFSTGCAATRDRPSRPSLEITVSVELPLSHVATVDLKPATPGCSPFARSPLMLRPSSMTHRLAPIVVGGISMGAAIALHLAVHRPGIVRGLILARPAWIVASAPANNIPNAYGRSASRGVFHRKMRERRSRLARSARLLAEKAPDNLASLRDLLFSRATSNYSCAASGDCG